MNPQVIEGLKDERQKIIDEYNIGVKRLESLANQVHSITILIDKYDSIEPSQAESDSTPQTSQPPSPITDPEPIEGPGSEDEPEPTGASGGSTTPGSGESGASPNDRGHGFAESPNEPTARDRVQGAIAGGSPRPAIKPGTKNTSQGTLEDKSSIHTGRIVTNLLPQKRRVGSATEDKANATQ